jgi:hypothetical protein
MRDTIHSCSEDDKIPVFVLAYRVARKASNRFVQTTPNAMVAIFQALVIATVSFFALGAEPLRADDRTRDEISAARSFKLESVFLGMSENEFRALFPNAAPLDDLTDANTGTTGLRVARTRNTDGIDAAFWKGRLIEFYAWYGAERANKLGSYITLIDRLVDKLGKADADSRGASEDPNSDEIAHLKWRIPQADFYCEILVKKKINRINVADMRAWTERDKLRADKADVGF